MVGLEAATTVTPWQPRRRKGKRWTSCAPARCRACGDGTQPVVYARARLPIQTASCKDTPKQVSRPISLLLGPRHEEAFRGYVRQALIHRIRDELIRQARYGG